METVKYLLFLWLFIRIPSSAQVMDGPIFSFEHLTWGMNIRDVPLALGGKELKPLDTQGHSLSQSGGETFANYYLDTIYAVRVVVALQFGKNDSLLKSVIVTSMAIDTSGQLKKNDDKIDRFRQKYSDRLGKAEKEKSIPFMGKMSTWSFKRTSVQMMELTSISMLSFTFLPNSPEE